MLYNLCIGGQDILLVFLWLIVNIYLESSTSWCYFLFYIWIIYINKFYSKKWKMLENLLPNNYKCYKIENDYMRMCAFFLQLVVDVYLLELKK